MPATLPTQEMPRPATEIIWSRGGECFRRMVWKEASEGVSFWGVIAATTFLLAVRFPANERVTVSSIWLHAAPALFALGFGARAFAQEIENGTWELLRSVGASSRDVWGSKLLVGAGGSLLLAGQSSLLAMSWPHPFLIKQLGVQTFWFAAIVLLTLAVSMQVSLLSRRVLTTLVVSTIVMFPVWILWVELAEYFALWEWVAFGRSGTQSLTHWACVVIAFLVIGGIWSWQLPLVSRRLSNSMERTDSRRWWKVFGRMVWKESRAAIDFWMAVAAIVALLSLSVWKWAEVAETRNGALIAFGVTFPLLHSLGCGAIAFAIEREDATQDWLRRISAPASAIYFAKWLVTQFSVLSLTSFVLLGTQSLVEPASRWSVDACAALLLTVALNGAVGLAASQLTRRVLPAVFTAFVLTFSIDWWFAIFFHDAENKLDRGNALALVPLWFVLMGLAVLTGPWLAERWLNERRWWKERSRDDSRWRKTSVSHATLFEHSASAKQRVFGRLLWREWMEAKCWLWTLPLALAPVLQGEMRNVNAFDAWRRTATEILIDTFGFLSLVLCVLPALLGVWSFHHDQRQSLFRFLADRGGSPKSIWLSKQAIWLTLVVVLTGLAGLLIDIQHHRVEALVTFVLFVGVQSFAAGQCLSQLIRSPLTSMFLAAVLSLLLAGWIGVLDRVHAPWPYQLGAAAILFFASWVHSRDWLEERSTWRAWGRQILAVVLPAVGMVLTLEVRGYPVWLTIRTFVASR